MVIGYRGPHSIPGGNFLDFHPHVVHARITRPTTHFRHKMGSSANMSDFKAGRIFWWYEGERTVGCQDRCLVPGRRVAWRSPTPPGQRKSSSQSIDWPEHQFARGFLRSAWVIWDLGGCSEVWPLLASGINRNRVATIYKRPLGVD